MRAARLACGAARLFEGRGRGTLEGSRKQNCLRAFFFLFLGVCCFVTAFFFFFYFFFLALLDIGLYLRHTNVAHFCQVTVNCCRFHSVSLFLVFSLHVHTYLLLPQPLLPFFPPLCKLRPLVLRVRGRESRAGTLPPPPPFSRVFITCGNRIATGLVFLCVWNVHSGI